MKSVVFCPAQSRHETTLLPLFRSQRKTSTKEGSSIARVWGVSIYDVCNASRRVLVKRGGDQKVQYPRYESKR